MPLKVIPEKMHSRLLAMFLNKILQQPIREGDLDFLEHRCISLNVSDTGIYYRISLVDRQFVPALINNSNDLEIQACVYDLLMLITRQEDPDTLVFQRRLIMQGNTELGLELKNFLDGLDVESTASFTAITSLLNKSLPAYRRLFS